MEFPNLREGSLAEQVNRQVEESIQTAKIMCQLNRSILTMEIEIGISQQQQN